jgi:TRAP transporter TAXI family solute receptor
MNLFKFGQEKKAKVKDFAGLKGKVVNIGNAGSGQRGTMEVLMDAKGVKNSFFKSTTELTSSEQVKALCDGKIDAFGYSVGFPNGAMENAASCGAKALPINLTGPEVQGLIDGAAYYAKAVIPKGTYTGQKKDVTTFGVKATVVTSANVSDELVYLVVKAVMENFDDFKKQHPAFASLKKEDMIAAGLSAPLHPGAIKYYKEAGLM